MGVRDTITNNMIETEKFQIKNNHTVGIYNYEPYHEFGKELVEFQYALYEDYLPEHTKLQYIQQTLYDLENWRSLYAFANFINGSFYVNFTQFNKSIKKGILSLSMMKTTKPCSTILYPFRMYTSKGNSTGTSRLHRDFSFPINAAKDEYCDYSNTEIFNSEGFKHKIIPTRARDFLRYVGNSDTSAYLKAILWPIVIHVAIAITVYFMRKMYKPKTSRESSPDTLQV
ncbi:hypothetical protein TVAG_444350 [Trichomonas vaginalis G3]|uniref:Uncharacterized protein n=1 Tax=Trichomonas vaginalis (strain ATCC PRA-98 / G3) TaxID=412133 RepID=A2E2H6_TRIV3|nr:hypothetical protein TVAGG3_0306110 [Trichomonas vaginalis G3]EAY13151.1 hypothetical protein TVAG_444350 [Trichomonas vaginalis G3]KAI5528265.1 hypothetical protein TVAGG3_0306110 [Trichomonas vaginalis G3]|eukprot:XP_001325374.1 hypothetical protein [Trichomonas vaginalis G3]